MSTNFRHIKQSTQLRGICAMAAREWSVSGDYLNPSTNASYCGGQS